MIRMFDDINVALIPKDAQAVAGYVNGRWPTYSTLVRMFPNAEHLSIAVSSAVDAECLDVEPGDATNAVAAAWVHRQMARGIDLPVVYTSLSNVSALLAMLAKAGIHRNEVRLWTAHYTNQAHICGPQCGLTTTADATQWTHTSHGRELDESLCFDYFFGASHKLGVTVAPKHQDPKNRRDVWRHHLHETQDVLRFVGPVPALKVAAHKLRGLLNR